MSLIKCPLLLFLFLLTLFVSGCVTPGRAYVKSIESGRYDESINYFSTLEDSDVEEIQEYSKTMSVRQNMMLQENYGRVVRNLMQRGNHDEAIKIARFSSTLFPNSAYFSRLEDDVSEEVIAYIRFKSKWSSSSSLGVSLSDIGEAESLVDDLSQYENYERDLHPELDLIEMRIYTHVEDLALQYLRGGEYDLVGQILQVLGQLEGYNQVYVSSCYLMLGVNIKSSSLLDFDSLVGAIGNTQECYREIDAINSEGFESEFYSDLGLYALNILPEMYSTIVDFDLYTEDLDRLEELRDNVPSRVIDRYDPILAEAHIDRASSLSGLGRASLLGIIHSMRAIELSTNQSVEAQNIIENSIQNILDDDDFLYDVYINPGQNVSIELYDFVYEMLSFSINERTVEPHQWVYAPKGFHDVSRYIEISNAVYYTPEEYDLIEVQSSYYSHNVRVPNQAKQLLAYRVNTADSQLRNAENAYNLAVSQYNIYPTTFSYNNVNLKYSQYQSALNNYNSLVRQYNLMPDYVERKHFEPYSFYEGEVHYGWRIQLRIHENGVYKDIVGDSVETSFIRVGTDYRDRNIEYRRDVPHGFDLSDSGFANKFVTALDQAVSELYTFMGDSVDIHYKDGISDYEVDIVRGILHPWGADISMVPAGNWIHDVTADIDLSQYKPERESYALVQPNFNGEEHTVRNWAAAYEESVVRIIADGPSGSYSSSGAIIRQDGLILTTAHGLLGNHLTVFLGANEDGYAARILQVNSNKDIALLKIESTREDFTSIPVRLDKSPARGESIIALGNPSLSERSVAINSVTQGIVSTPNSSGFGMPRIVADISIASGSSGGPLISTEDGSIIGVVSEVASPEFGQGERSASGSFALAIPATSLGEWIGLVYE